MDQGNYWENLLAAEGMPSELPSTGDAASANFGEPDRSEPVRASHDVRDVRSPPNE